MCAAPRCLRLPRVQEALSLVEPLIEDPVGYVRQGALIAMALIMMQQPNSNPKSKWVREQFVKIIADKRQDILAKFGAIYAQGLIECGGRNVTARLINEEGHIRMQAVVGMLLFSQFWFWFPLGHCISLALTPTTMVCLNTDLKMPKNVKIKSNAPPSKYAYPPATEPPKEKSKEKVETAVLSTTSKTKAKAKAKKDKDGKAEGSMDTADDAAAKKAGEAKEKDASMDTKDDDAAKAKAEESKAAEPEAAFQILENPARVVAAQVTFRGVFWVSRAFGAAVLPAWRQQTPRGRGRRFPCGPCGWPFSDLPSLVGAPPPPRRPAAPVPHCS